MLGVGEGFGAEVFERRVFYTGSFAGAFPGGADTVAGVGLATVVVDDVEALQDADSLCFVEDGSDRSGDRDGYLGTAAVLGFGGFEVDRLISDVGPLEQADFGSALVEQVTEVDVALDHLATGGFSAVLAGEQGVSRFVEFFVRDVAIALFRLLYFDFTAGVVGSEAATC